MKTPLKRLILAALPACAWALLLAGCAETRPRRNPIPCAERARFGDPAASDYVLPFPVGKAYILSQSCCNPRGGHRNQLAYDFALPIGAEVAAAKDGMVKKIREDQPDAGDDIKNPIHNFIMILHDDGTVAFYAHLKQDSVTVAVGDTVAAGDTAFCFFQRLEESL